MAAFVNIRSTQPNGKSAALMGERLRLQTRSSLRLAAELSTLLVLACSGTTALAGPHHWWIWRKGIISGVDPAAKSIALSRIIVRARS